MIHNTKIKNLIARGGGMFLLFLKFTLNNLFKLFKFARFHFTYTFVLVVFMFVFSFNVMENSGRISAFSLGILNAETDTLESTNRYARASVLSGRDFNSKDSLSYDEVDMPAKGGPEDIDYPEIGTTGDDSLTSSLAALTIYTSQNERVEQVIYTVEAGDTVSKIASEFGVTISTVLWANGLSATSYIKEGQELVILPVTGIQHDVKSGDTVLAIAKKYYAKADDIISYNGLPADGALQIGETLIVPDGEMPRVYAPVKRTVVTYAQSTVNANAYFIFPASGRRTQGPHGYNAIDVGNRCGTPIYAAAAGTITSAKATKSRARLGASVFGGYGNHVTIKHPNGTVTLYAHLKDIFVGNGGYVQKGQQIGTMGGGFEYINGRLLRMQGAGKSTGCHLHFEVRGASNPLSKYWRY